MPAIAFRLILISILCIIFQSCSLVPHTSKPLNKHIDTLILENQYDEIDKILNNMDKKNPDFKNISSRKKSILKKKTTYINSVIASANTLKAKNQWQNALNTYNSALDKIEDNPVLEKEKQTLLKERDKKVNNLRKDLLLQQANALISYKKIYSQLHQLVPDDYSAQFDIQRFEKDKLEIANHLEKCGEQASKNKQYTMARDCYSLSNKLAPTKQKLARVNKIDAQLKKKASQKRHNELLSAYKSAYAKQEYNKAKMHLNTLLAINPKHKQAINYLESLNIEINEQVSKNITSGKELYSQNKIDEALIEWKKAQQLEPDNDEIIQLINRAEKVSKKIERLEHSQ